MSGKSTAFADAFLKLIFNGTAIANIADNAASSPLTHLYCSLHTVDPGLTNDQTSGEATYTGYARAAVARNSGGWTVSSNTVTPTVDILFPVGTGGFDDLLFYAIGTASTGTGSILFSGAFSTDLYTGSATQPVIPATTIITET